MTFVFFLGNGLNKYGVQTGKGGGGGELLDAAGGVQGVQVRVSVDPSLVASYPPGCRASQEKSPAPNL